MRKTVFILLFLLTTSVLRVGASDLDSIETSFFNKIKKGVINESERKQFNELTHLYEIQDPRKGIEMVYKVLGYSIKFKNVLLEHDCYNALGVLYLELDMYGKALENLLLADYYYKKDSNIGASSWTLINIGNVYYFVKEYKKALGYYLLANKNFRKLYGRSEILDTIKGTIEDNYEVFGMSVALNNIALCYREQGNYKTALVYHKKALRLREIISSKMGIAITYNYIGICYSLMNTGNPIDNYYKKALDILRDTFNLSYSDKFFYINQLGQTYKKIGELFAKEKNYKKARVYYDSSIACLIKLESKNELIRSYLSFSKVLATLGNKKLSIDYAQKALQLSNEKKYYSNSIVALIQLVSLYKSLGDYKKALEYARQEHEIDSLQFQNNKYSRIRAAERDFELKMRTQDIIDLKEYQEKQEQSISEQRTIIVFLIIISLVVLIVLLVIYNFFKQKRKSALMLEKKNIALAEVNKKLQISEAKLAEINEQLKQQNRNLEQSERDLTELNNTKDKFFSIIAHDLRGPISTLMHVTELVHDSYDDMAEEKKKDFLLEVKNSAGGLFNLLDNLLVWSYSQRGTIPFHPSKIELYRIVETNLSVLKMSAENKNIELVSSIDKDSIIFADNNMMTTVVRNLISNAIKFTNEGGRIEVGARRLEDFYEVSVKDSGVGMSEEVRSKVFEIDKSATTLGTAGEKGTGLGLVICKEFVEKNGGSIRVESQIGEGSSFVFTVPAAKALDDSVLA